MKDCSLLVTFDYELFLGSRSGRPENCVLTPSKLLGDIMYQHKTRGVFFVDTTYLCKLNELSPKHPECAKDFKAIAAQLLALIDQGHYIFPHIHPHWQDAIYLPNEQEFDLSNVRHYRFNNLSAEEKRKVFKTSVEVLQEIIFKHHPAYKINAFRAGGWCIQPFTDFKPYFEEFEIKYDMSVISRIYQMSTAQQFDFSTAPEKYIYRFSEDVCKEDPNGKFVQVCGSIVDMPASSELLSRIHRKFLNRTIAGKEYGSGQGQVPTQLENYTPTSSRGYEISAAGREFASLEKMSTFKLPVYINHLKKTKYLHLISHPKMINRHQVKILSKLLKTATTELNTETDYITISDSYLNKSAT